MGQIQNSGFNHTFLNFSKAYGGVEVQTTRYNKKVMKSDNVLQWKLIEGKSVEKNNILWRTNAYA